jgi:hypothetical protein
MVEATGRSNLYRQDSLGVQFYGTVEKINTGGNILILIVY